MLFAELQEACCPFVHDSPTNLCLLSEARKHKRVMKVPKGTSDYQATWIVDDGASENGEADEESSEEDDDDDDMLDEAMEDEDDMSQVNISSFTSPTLALGLLHKVTMVIFVPITDSWV